MSKRAKPAKQVQGRVATSLLGLVAADRAEYGPSTARDWRSVPRWSPAESRVIERYARAALDGRYANMVLVVKDCRDSLVQAEFANRRKRSNPPLRTRQAVHAMLVKAASRLGRPPVRVRWSSGERALLDRFALAVAENRYEGAREAGTDCRDAISRLHRRSPGRYAGFPERSLHTIQHGIWPRVAKLRWRWFGSHWSSDERALVDRYARSLIAHRFPNVKAASRACHRAVNHLHTRLARKRGSRPPGEVRTLPAVFEQLLVRSKQLAPYQISHRRWTAPERRIAARWTRRYVKHVNGKLTMNLFTIAELLQAELGRRGYYRNLQACVTEIVTQRREGRTSGESGE